MPELSRTEARVLKFLDGGIGRAMIARALGLEIDEVQAALSALQLLGLASGRPMLSDRRIPRTRNVDNFIVWRRTASGDELAKGR